ncbi:MAG: hypothetical protein M2R46_00681 [Verrucomicrobia subdivision 3 bacterium]|nr:hypothetical protein [Limisphaerales bacterium]
MRHEQDALQKPVINQLAAGREKNHQLNRPFVLPQSSQIEMVKPDRQFQFDTISLTFAALSRASKTICAVNKGGSVCTGVFASGENTRTNGTPARS